MEKAKSKVLEGIRENGRYRYSTDVQERLKEQNAVNELEADGLITSVSKAIGEVYAKPL